METFDIVLDDNGEFIEVSDDFKAAKNDNRLMSYIILAAPGEYKEFPLLGVGIDSYLNSTVNSQVIQRNIIDQLKSDIFRRTVVNMDEWPAVIKVDKLIIDL